ncbi:Hsp20/alpha crystallin family protein [Singulisphaera acidiphila]|uniref:Molecular chaperone (Small heat shock protein) n=1 Tax=Singulisphaera acidiphila (strain ATCC BAA-1392 / DSM 18658 / VKM B-2454 / MOB10) TaxID=886293 RepID=L0DGI8_SINAD|nr:Hsp20/alpha crystallin family protein [Singulisphaera acidiphila]AGA28367.1 molecular chaperone (small heat shock protein) [Singulisphaera acidiphila DSM 18658]
MHKAKERGNGSARKESELRTTDRAEGRPSALTPRELATASPWLGDPFAVMHRFAEEMDRVFEGFGIGHSGSMAPWSPARRHAPHEEGFALAGWSPQVEVFERGGQLVVRADLPGLNKDNVQVEVTNEAVLIRGERRQEHEDRREGFYHTERSYGSFCRSIPLPEGVEVDQADANFRDGVLEVTIPAPPRPASQGRRLEVKG